MIHTQKYNTPSSMYAKRGGKRGGVIKACLLMLLMCISGMTAWGAKVTVKVDAPDGMPIAVGDRFYIIITASDCQGEWDVPSHFPGAQLLYQSQGSSQSTVISNGRTVRNFTEEVTLTLRATSEGRFTYGPATKLPASGQKVSYTIVGGRAQSHSGAQTPDNSTSGAAASQGAGSNGPQFVGKGNENMFLRAEVSNSGAYEQQGIVYTIKLYTTYNYIKFLGATAAPKFDGFVVEEEKSNDPQWRLESYNGRTYKVATVARYVIFPQKAGRLTVKGNTYTVSADAMEYYNDPFYRRIQVKRPVQLNITPNDVVVNARPLPSPAPEGFSGGVGQFTISSSLPKQVFKTNNAASIIYTVRGSGNIKYIKLPDLKDLYPATVEVFEPETNISADVVGGRVQGSIKFDYSFMPTETGDLNIPDIKFVYFDPSSGTYQTAVAKGYHIKVEKGAASDKSQKSLHFDDRLMKVKGALEKVHLPDVYKFSYWLWYIIPTLLLIGATAVRMAYGRKYSDVAALRQKRATAMAMKRLKHAVACMKRHDSAHFYDEMLRALWGYLGDRLRMPTSELSRQNVRQVLEARHIKQETIDRLMGLIDSCEYAKYTGGNQEENMKELVDEGVNVINRLEPEFKEGKRLDKAASKGKPTTGYDIDSDLDAPAK